MDLLDGRAEAADQVVGYDQHLCWDDPRPAPRRHDDRVPNLKPSALARFFHKLPHSQAIGRRPEPVGVEWPDHSEQRAVELDLICSEDGSRLTLEWVKPVGAIDLIKILG